MYLEKELERIYTRDKRGKIRIFLCFVYRNPDGTGLIVSKTGGLRNKLVEQKKHIKRGKNHGKTNETTPIEQAIKTAESKWRDKLKEGYKTISQIVEISGNPLRDENFEDYLYNNLPKFNTDEKNQPKPMLADKWTKHGDKTSFPVLIQPKFDGVRCLHFWRDGVIKQISREGREYNVEHIKDEIFKLFLSFPEEDRKNIVFDGELYVHGLALQDIVSKVKSYDMFNTDITYQLYDIFDLKNSKWTQESRFYFLTTLIDNEKNNPNITQTRLALTNKVDSSEEMMRFHKAIVNDGYEGTIVRPLKALYLPGFRDKALLKVKDVFSEEFDIVGVDLEAGKPKKDFTWICVTEEGNKFKVKPHGTVKERENYYNNWENYIDKELQLTFHGWTNDKKPFHVTGVTVRDYE